MENNQLGEQQLVAVTPKAPSRRGTSERTKFYDLACQVGWHSIEAERGHSWPRALVQTGCALRGGHRLIRLGDAATFAGLTPCLS